MLDSTLREGELFRLFPPETKLRIASLLVEVGVSRLELTVDYRGRTSVEDVKPVVELVKEHGALPILHGRATGEDVDAIGKYGEVGCALYMSLSSLHLEYKLGGLSLEEAVDRMVDSIERAGEYGFPYIRATIEDASRIFLEDKERGVELMGRIIERFREAGANIVSIPDTAGLLTPTLAREFINRMKQASSLPLAVHFHNDYGLASANTVEAALAGADELHATIMGIGDRNGIADIYEVVATLEDVHGISLGVERSKLAKLYRDFARVTGIRIPWRHPLSEEARTIRAGVHQSMTVKKPEGYIPSGKLKHDFNQPIYELNPYLSHKLIQAIIGDKQIGREELKRIAEKIASIAKVEERRINLEKVRQILLQETGVEVPLSRLEQFLGVERVYILLRLDPNFPVSNIIAQLMQDQDVEGVDEVYGDADMIIVARLRRSEENNIINRIRRNFGHAIEDMKILITD